MAAEAAEGGNMRKRIAVLLTAAVVETACMTGCKNSGRTAANNPAAENSAQAETEEAGRTAADAEQKSEDRKAADEVAALIDAIYVQERMDETDEQCAAAKAAWDALTDEQKELVEGENADPDYFGRDTGDASEDDPRNQDDIGENELLVVSFGTSFNDSRAADIKGIEDALQEAYPDWSVRRAFTAQIIINHVQARDGEFIDNMDQALERAAANGVKNLVIQPTHLMHGAEYDELIESVEEYRDQFETVKVAEPLLGEVGADATVINSDKAVVAEAITAEAVKAAGYDSLRDAKEDGTAFVFMGHGTSHTAKVSYSQMQTQMNTLGYANVFIGTVEGEPEETACEAVMEAAVQAGYRKVVLRPLMVVAGDHANNDMAGEDEDSWLSVFKASGKFENVDTQISGLGSIEAIQKLYVVHTAAALGMELKNDGTAGAENTALTDGVYLADFDTDSSMFHVSEACNGKGTLTVKDGKMAIHVSLASKNIVNLYPGLAAEAQKDADGILAPTEDTVIYSDGLTETVYGFDVPVPVLGEEFDLALVGTRGTWYDHKVSISNPEPLEGKRERTLLSLSDGAYTIDLTFEGGSGKAQILSPAAVTVSGETVTARVQWSSPNYDYMIVGGEKFLPVNASGNSAFEIPVPAFDEPVPIIGDTMAMSVPHEIEYTVTFHSDTIKAAE